MIKIHIVQTCSVSNHKVTGTLSLILQKQLWARLFYGRHLVHCSMGISDGKLGRTVLLKPRQNQGAVYFSTLTIVTACWKFIAKHPGCRFILSLLLGEYQASTHRGTVPRMSAYRWVCSAEQQCCHPVSYTMKLMVGMCNFGRSFTSFTLWILCKHYCVAKRSLFNFVRLINNTCFKFADGFECEFHF